MSTITKLTQDVTQYYKNITSQTCANARIQKDTIMNNTQDAHKLQKENLRDEQGAWKDRALDGQPKIHASSAHL